MPHEQPHYGRDGKPKLEHEEGHQRDEMLQRGLRSRRLHAFLKGFQDDRRLLLHVGKGTARIVHDDLLHIRVKDIRIAKQGTDKRQLHERNEHSLHEGFTALSFQKSHTSSDTKSFIVTGRP